jgi:hypothetical protein
VLSELLDYELLDDPLLRFIECVQSGRGCAPAETVNLAALFSCAGAVADAQHNVQTANAFQHRLHNAERVAAVASEKGWRAQMPTPGLRTGILILKRPAGSTEPIQPDAYRASFQEHGIALSAYTGGLLRLSMPAMPLTDAELAVLEKAFVAMQ